MQFKSTIGQIKNKESLVQLVDAGRIPHAMLFLGPTGCGKLQMAIALSQYILCSQKKNGDSCKVCSNCQKAQKLIHPDIHFSYPVVGANKVSTDFLPQWRASILENPFLNINQWLSTIGAENKQGNINKRECLRIVNQLSLKSFESDYKIIIVWLPEYLKKEGNRLLKLIEEPPENTIFILVAEVPDQILATILSRCQITKFSTLSDETIIDSLIKQENITNEQATTIAYLADGNYNKALSLLNHIEDDNATLFLSWLRKCYIGNGLELVQYAEKFASIGKERQKHFFHYGLHFIRELMVCLLTNSNAVRLLPTELKTAVNLSKIMTVEQLETITQLFNECAYFIERNANAKILSLNASIKIHRIFKG